MKANFIAKTLGVILPLLCALSAPAQADAVSDFYKGKQDRKSTRLNSSH